MTTSSHVSRPSAPLLCAFAMFLGVNLPARAQEPPLDMVLVPAGEFKMGANEAETPGPNKPRSTSDAIPKHTQNLPAFFIDKTEVTNEAYQKFCEATKYPVPPHWRNGNFPAGENLFPVTHINWWEAKAYAVWAGKRLPTESEWEKAARGTDERIFPWGNDWSQNRLVWGGRKPDKVGTKPEGASPFGALDMAGNVYEWTESWYAAYPGSPHKFVEYGKKLKVIRGGAFEGGDSIARTYFRSVTRPQTRSEWIGFRCAKDAP